MGIQQIANGEITNGLNSFVGALLLPLVGPGLSNLELINDVVPNPKAPVQNVLNLLDVAPTVLLNVGIAPIQVLSDFTNALGNGIEGLRDAVLSGNPENVVNAVINATAGFASAAENSLVGEARHDRGGGQRSRRRHLGRGRRDEHRRDDEDVDLHEVGLRRCVEQHRLYNVEG
jgi:hypothetical protein